MSFPVLMTGVTPPGSGRVRLHPGDADRFEQQHSEALSRRQAAFDSEMRRLEMLAERKQYVDRMQSPGPVDQELSLRTAGRSLAREGIKPNGTWAEDFSVWATSKPRTRNIALHASLIPENMILGAMDALSDQKPDALSRLAAAVPGAFYPPAGNAIEPARDDMYESLGPIGGTVVDFAMPGIGVPEAKAASRAVGGAYRVLDGAWRNAVRADLVDAAGDTIRKLRASR